MQAMESTQENWVANSGITASHRHVHWHFSLEKFSKIRKRQNKNPTADAESVDQSPPSDGTTSGDQGLKPTADQQPGFHDHKPSLWRKRVRTVLLRLRGQEQHKDVYIIPQHLRAQLKQMYVY